MSTSPSPVLEAPQQASRCASGDCRRPDWQCSLHQRPDFLADAAELHRRLSEDASPQALRPHEPDRPIARLRQMCCQIAREPTQLVGGSFGINRLHTAADIHQHRHGLARRRDLNKNPCWIQQHPDRHPQRDSSQQPKDDRIPRPQNKALSTERPRKQPEQYQRKHNRNRQPDWPSRIICSRLLVVVGMCCCEFKFRITSVSGTALAAGGCL